MKKTNSAREIGLHGKDTDILWARGLDINRVSSDGDSHDWRREEFQTCEGNFVETGKGMDKLQELGLYRKWK